MAPSFDLNPLTKMWCLGTRFWVLSSSFLEYVKLVELAMVQIVGSMEDERCFSTLAFMKSKLQNRLTTHLPLVRMFAQQFYTLQKLPIWRLYLVMAKRSPLILLWWLDNKPSIFFGLVFAKANMYCCKIEWLFYEPEYSLSMALAFFALFSECNVIGLSFCLL